jgi:putative colanic acid biosynthesis glycosyltransferase
MALFSIITVTYNAEDFIEASVKGMMEQTFGDYEYIIIDGGSTDNTVNIIKQYDSVIHKFITEKDGGIYDAMNKGLNLSTGEYILFVGADDKLADKNVLSDIANKVQHGNLEFIYGNVIYNTGRTFLSAFGPKMLLNNTIHHQSAFYHRSLFKDFRYDVRFKLIADYELNIDLYRKKKLLRYSSVDRTICICHEGGASRARLRQAYTETNQIRQKVLGKGSLFLKWIYTIKFFLTEYVI